MRWLRGFSLACSLLAAALLPGPRRAPAAAAAAAAFESELGFSDTEPDAGEAKVGAGCTVRAEMRWGGVGTAGIGPPGTQNPAERCVCGCHLVCVGYDISERSARLLGGNFFSSLFFFTESCY